MKKQLNIYRADFMPQPAKPVHVAAQNFISCLAFVEQIILPENNKSIHAVTCIISDCVVNDSIFSVYTQPMPENEVYCPKCCGTFLPANSKHSCEKIDNATTIGTMLNIINPEAVKDITEGKNEIPPFKVDLPEELENFKDRVLNQSAPVIDLGNLRHLE
jgi:hypothetical protein